MSAIALTLLTADEFWQLPEDGRRCELVHGEVVETMPPGAKHGAIAARMSRLLLNWLENGPGGYVGVEAGFMLARDPDTVRAPDVAYVAAARIPAGGVPEGFWPLAPDLAVEVVSPAEAADEVREKVRSYLAAGVLEVWLVFPRTREVLIHTPDGIGRAYDATAALTSALLPGFVCPLADLFA